MVPQPEPFDATAYDCRVQSKNANSRGPVSNVRSAATCSLVGAARRHAVASWPGVPARDALESLGVLPDAAAGLRRVPTRERLVIPADVWFAGGDARDRRVPHWLVPTSPGRAGSGIERLGSRPFTYGLNRTDSTAFMCCSRRPQL